MSERKSTPNILDDLMSAAPAGPQQPAATGLRIAEIRRDGGTQPRSGLDEAHVQDLVAALAAGDELPPVDVVFDGAVYWLYDGYHRTEAASRSGRYTVQAIIHQGTQADAQWESYAANSKHGLKRTNDDKRRQVMAALRHPKGVSMSDREIAQHVGVDHKTIGAYRSQLEMTGEIPQSDTRTGADGRTINTAKIGTTRPQPKRDDAAEDTWTAKQETLAGKAHRQLSDADLLYALRRYWGKRGEDLLKRIDAAQTPIAAVKTHLQEREPEIYFEDIRCKCVDGGITIWLTKYGAMSGRPADARYTYYDWAVATVARLRQALADQPPTGHPLMQVLKTDEEIAADAQAADIASREAAAAEAARQVAADPYDHTHGDAIRNDLAALEAKHVAAAAAADVAFGMAPPRQQVLAKLLQDVIDAIPELQKMTKLTGNCIALQSSAAQVYRALVASTQPVAAPAAEPTELPADLVAHGWELRRTRENGGKLERWYAAVTVEGEEREIKTMSREKIANVIGDCRYMEKQLQIGGAA